MGKAERVKTLRKLNQPTPVGQPFILQLMSNGDVEIQGNADMNPVGIMDIFSKALRGLAQHHAKKIKSQVAKQECRIIKP